MKRLVILISVLAVAGCSAKTGNPVLEGSESGIKRQMQPLQTKSDVRDKFGNPDLVFKKDGLEAYEYKRIDGGGRYQWLIPILGYIMSIWQDRYTYEETNLFIKFDSQDRVKDWSVIQSGGTAN